MVAVPVAVEPDIWGEENVTVGAEVYPLPPLVTETEATGAPALAVV
jgi:hypothetical protein